MNTYTVQPGDTLESIAEKLYGDRSMVQYLASINSLKSVPDPAGNDFWVYGVTPGQILKTDVPEVTAKKYNWPVVIGGTLTAALAIYYRKEIVSFFKNMV
jgi:hypothetical protein